MIIQDEKLFAAIFHGMLTKIVDEISNIHWLPIILLCRDRQGMSSYIREEHLKPTPIPPK